MITNNNEIRGNDECVRKPIWKKLPSRQRSKVSIFSKKAIVFALIKWLSASMLDRTDSRLGPRRSGSWLSIADVLERRSTAEGCSVPMRGCAFKTFWRAKLLSFRDENGLQMLPPCDRLGTASFSAWAVLRAGTIAQLRRAWVLPLIWRRRPLRSDTTTRMQRAFGRLQGLVAGAGEIIRLRPNLGRRTAFFVTLFAKR